MYFPDVGPLSGDDVLVKVNGKVVWTAREGKLSKEIELPKPEDQNKEPLLRIHVGSIGRPVWEGVTNIYILRSKAAAQGPMRPAQKPGAVKDAVVGRWVSDDADRIPVEFGADGSIRLALCQLDCKWQMAEGTYVVSDDGRVKYTAKLGGLVVRGQFTMKNGVLIGPSGSSPAARWKKVPKGPMSGTDPPAAPERDPEEVFRKACDLVAALEGKHDLLKGVAKVKPAVQWDERKRLKSAHLSFENNAVPPGKNDAKAKDDSQPFFYVSVQVWSGRTQSPPANLHEFEWQGRTYQMWVRVYGSDAELVKKVHKSVDEPLREPLPRKAPPSGKWRGSRSSLQALAPVTTTVLAAVAKEKVEILSRNAAHLSTQTTLGKGEVIEGGGYVFFARCRQKFQVLEILHGNGKLGDIILEYGIVEKTEGFPLPAVQEPIPPGVKFLLLMGEKGNILKALPATQENRKAVRTVLSEPKEKKVEPDLPASAHEASDVVLIANWVCGNDPAKAFTKPFGDSKCLSDGKDPLLYTDIPDVKPPAGMKAVNYEFAQARMQRIKHGHKASSAVLIVRSSLDEPAEDEIHREKLERAKGEPGGRVYYVEVAIGNLAWHWLKVVVRDEGDKPNAKILWHKVS